MPRHWDNVIARSFDVIVVGAGCAGQTMANQLRHFGCRVLLVERNDTQDSHSTIGSEGAFEYRNRTVVERVEFQAGRATGVWLRSSSGVRYFASSHVVVDASGKEQLIASQLGMRPSGFTGKKSAIWGYYRDAFQGRPPDEEISAPRFFHTDNKSSWFWFVPIDKHITSIGVVGDAHYLIGDRCKPEVTFEDELVRCPALTRRLLSARLLCEFRTVEALPYAARTNSGDGWLAIGDAWGYFSPVHPSDERMAKRSAEFAALAVIDSLRRDRFSASQLGRWSERFQTGSEWVRAFITSWCGVERKAGRSRRVFTGLEYRPKLLSLPEKSDAAAMLRRTEHPL